MKVLGVIPARAGSKGIPGKNIINLNGKPLIYYMISAALHAKQIDRVIVSTEDDQIAAVARDCGAEIPFVRPRNLSKDDVSAISVAKHALEHFDAKGENYDIVASLQLTTPLVSSRDIDKSLSLMWETGCDACFTMKEVEEHHPSRIYAMNGDRVLMQPYTSEAHLQRQDREPVYKMDGAVIARKASLLRQWQGEDLAFGDDRRGVKVPWYRGIDINEPLDLIVAEAIMKQMNWLEDDAKIS